MNPIAIALLSLAMSTDAFAAAVGKGMALQRPHWREALRTGMIFGAIEGTTPLIGWALGLAAADYVKAWDHWIAFALLLGLGAHMVLNGLAPPEGGDAEKPARHGFWVLALTGFATSVDALVVGVGLAFLDVPILPVAAAIGATTLAAVTLGVMAGRVLGRAAGKRAEMLGGLVLVGIGCTILFEHLSGA
ncbi:MAG: manganese efflux pump [Burkholderiaceae bacterium]|jgi:putative Mn2+ efflux pump MntP|nr:manganese efflux pump [Burkholderiaceae bacterium]